MKKVLVLGAGLVAKPLVRYLLDQPDYEVTVATRTVSKAVKLIDNHPRGTAKTLNLKDVDSLRDEVKACDIAISLVPYAFHTTVARFCIEFKKQMVTTSYVSAEMKALDAEAREAGIMVLNETGLDPGIDHMEAMRIIHEVRDNGGDIDGFTSYCGGLPAPEANTNPYGYKFSWSPIGVLLAGTNSAQYRMDGEEVFITPEELFETYKIINIEGLGDFEGYPNRDSLPYLELYGVEDSKTMLRGTLRNIGWCPTLKKIGDLGLLEKEEGDWTGMTYNGLLRKLMKDPGEADIRKALGTFLNIDADSDIIDRLEWLGLLSETPLPLEKASPLDILGETMLQKLQFEEGERDMIVLQHKFDVSYDSGNKERITSTLIDFGIPHGDSSMARTVSLPAAIATRMILEGEITETGVHIPVTPEIYVPILKELKEMDIEFTETREEI